MHVPTPAPNDESATEWWAAAAKRSNGRPPSKLTLAIREHQASNPGLTPRQLAKRFNKSEAYVRKALNGGTPDA